MSAMRIYERDEYEDLDEYEDDVEEQEYEGDEDGYEEEEVHQPTQEEMEYLELRQRLKESIRKSMKKELGTANSSSRDKKNVVRKDNYGSFFGPSQPVIAQRVIQESRSLLENPSLAARISKPNNVNNKNSVSTTVAPKPRASIPKAMNVVKQKVEVLKNTRDYSFLLSEDAELPAQFKRPPPPRNISARKPEVRSAQSLPKSKQVGHEHGRDVLNGCGGRKQVLPNSQIRSKVGLEKTATASKLSMDYRKQLGSNSASGPGRPVGPKGVPSKIPVPTTVKKVTQPVAKSPTAGARKPLPSQQQPGLRKPTQSHLQSGLRRPTPSHSQSSVSKNTPLQRNMYPETSKPKVMPRPPSRDEVKRPSPNIAGRGVSADQRLKPKLGKQPYGDSDDEDDPIKAIRKMFGYNRNKYQYDEDGSDMEANFDEILMEEKRSSQIARKEDEEQARLLEEEERRKRSRMAKKRKMGH